MWVVRLEVDYLYVFGGRQVVFKFEMVSLTLATMLHTCEDAPLLNSHHPPRLLVIRRRSGEVTVELVVAVVLLLTEEKYRTEVVGAELKQSIAAEGLGASSYGVADCRMWLVELPRHRCRFGRTFLLVTGSLELQLA